MEEYRVLLKVNQNALDFMGSYILSVEVCIFPYLKIHSNTFSPKLLVTLCSVHCSASCCSNAGSVIEDLY